MFNMLSSDFYKLFKRKSFYFCAVLSVLSGMISIFGLITIGASYNFSISEIGEFFGFNGIGSIAPGLIAVNIFFIILASMFVPSEFSFGTIKNIVSRGISRTKIYISKLLISWFLVLFYSILSAMAAFSLGAYYWGVGDFSAQNVVLGIFRMLGLYLLSAMAFQSMFVMIGFLVRHTGGTVSTSLGIVIVLPIVINFVKVFFTKTFKIENFNPEKYWVGSIIDEITKMDVTQEAITRGILVSCVYLVLFTLIGIYSFNKRDIK
ncbi:MAG: ABC transporter permease [Candidatus Paraimprobicoccus trichonymphae]|uniref:ABC transporter permease n=1 Tax=Candidatus Paraimprobicoccus trichonymphae TaxID=3033793 RepID=A0AA48HW31_9FIRM|nr:MAG: ABC transporter permease [Candidatus Paraimprobicoccus trichonymphae]